MSLKKLTPQHQHRCYCSSELSTCCNGSNNIAYCMRLQQPKCGTASKASATTKTTTANSKQKHKSAAQQFVKIKRRDSSATTTTTTTAANARRGLGHSQASGANFSRRNSAATTVTFSSACVSPTALPSLPSTLSHSSNDGALATLGALRHEYTEQRRYYESAKQLLALVNAQSAASDSADMEACLVSPAEHERLLALQRFRLQHADECFSVHRQQDLLLQQQRDQLRGRRSVTNGVTNGSGSPALWTITMKPCVGQESTHKQQQQKSKRHKEPLVKEEKLTPYAVRQRLLRLRLEAQEIERAKPGRNLYGALDKSCALRYQETY